jgi:subtilisin family serine protease
MNFTKLVFGLGLILAVSGCGSVKKSTVETVTTPETPKEFVMQIATDNVVAKKGKMSKEEIQKWPHMDIFKDSVPGMSLDKAYEFLKDKTPHTIIVGVIDSGIDIEHEDLKNVAWTNEDEIPNNGKDDDNNGYIDDIHGWNFLGGEAGSSAPEQLEITRIVAKLAPKYAGKSANDIAAEDKEEFEYYTELNEKVATKQKQAAGQMAFYQGLVNTVKEADEAVKKVLGKDVYTVDELTALNDESVNPQAKGMLLKMLASGATVEESIKGIQEGVDYFKSQAETMYNIDFRGRVTGDDPEDITDTNYGNNNTIGSKDDEIHGTHVSGIICAERNNGIGMNGVAGNVKLLSVRAVPDGDEYDKDVALAIRYAVDNGAKVINMSFGKSYSPHAEWVYDAIKYAESKDVLLVHAAGNDAKDIDVEDNFPNDSKDKINEFADNVITVGAMTRHFDENISAGFSNYGIYNVDIFAPGKTIYATFPKDKYQSISGTSMASPEVAGVAALIRSYYPSLTASQVKNIIMDSGIAMHQVVKMPAERGTKAAKRDFDSLSVSGRILNAYNAVILADQIVNGK